MPVLERSDTARISWEANGPDDGQAVLLIMGLAYPAAMWFRLMPALTERYRVIRVDNRGAGHTGDVPGAPYTVETMAAQFIERYAKPKNKSWQGTERTLALHVLPRWGKRVAASITRRDVLDLLDELVAGTRRVGAVVGPRREDVGTTLSALAGDQMGESGVVGGEPSVDGR